MADVKVLEVPHGSLVVLYDVEMPDEVNVAQVLATAIGHEEFAVLELSKGGRVMRFTDAGELPDWIAAKLSEVLERRLDDHVASTGSLPTLTVPASAVQRDG